MKISLTIDDAPSTLSSAGSLADPSRMDTMRDQLKVAGIKHCVAFVTGKLIKGNEPILERWLSDGFELGNHSFSHVPASKIGYVDFIKDLIKCDKLLEEIVYNGSSCAKWFRFPCLDRGACLSDRKKIDHVLKDLGYSTAHASFDFFDYLYDSPTWRAHNQGDAFVQSLVARRYRKTVLSSLAYADKRLAGVEISDRIHIGYCHFGLISSQQLPNILETFNFLDCEWKSLRSACEKNLYSDFDADLSLNGLVSNNYGNTIRSRIKRHFFKAIHIYSMSSEKRLGPRRPYL